MTSKNLQAIVLAAGKSKRFRTEKSKLMEKICGQEMVLYVTKLLDGMNIPTTLVVGFQREQIMRILKKHHDDHLEFVIQEDQQGTGHAILCAKSHLKKENILIIIC